MNAWHFIKFSAERHPNITEGREVIPGGITREWVEARRQEWGENDPRYIARVLGEFPTSGVGAVFPEPEAAIRDTASADAPRKPRRSYVLGVDLGKHQDPTWMAVMDVKTGDVVHLDSWLHVPWPETLDRIAAYSKRFKGQMWLDATGVGDPVYDNLVERGLNVPRQLPPIPGMVNAATQLQGRRRASNARYGELIGYKFSNESKSRLVLWLVDAIEDKAIGLPANEGLGAELLQQLRAFEYTLTPNDRTKYNAPAGQHDDAVIALALANMGRENWKPVSRPGITSLSDKETRPRDRGESFADEVVDSGRAKRDGWW